jgi:energy-coupling factor transport system permease protein
VSAATDIRPGAALATGAVRDRRRTALAERALRARPRRGLAAIDAAASVLYLIALAFAAFVVTNPVQVLVLLAVLSCVLVAAGRVRATLPYLRVALYVAGFLALLNPLFSQGGVDVLWQAHLPLVSVRLTVQGIWFGVGTALRLTAVLLAFALYNTVLDPDDQLALMSRFSFRSGLVVSLATRLFPVLSRDAGRIADAQRSRGVELDAGRRRDRAAARIPLLSALLTQSLERALEVAASMEARGYGRTSRTRWRRGGRWRTPDRVTAAAAVGTAGALVGGLVSGAFHFAYFPLVDNPWPALGDPWWLIALIALVVPLAVQVPWQRSRA